MDTMELLPVDEDDDTPGLPGVLLAVAAAVTAVLAVQGRPWFAWLLGDWSWRSWLIPAALVVLASTVAAHGWRNRGGMHPVAYPALITGMVLLVALRILWNLSTS